MARARRRANSQNMRWPVYLLAGRHSGSAPRADPRESPRDHKLCTHSEGVVTRRTSTLRGPVTHGSLIYILAQALRMDSKSKVRSVSTLPRTNTVVSERLLSVIGILGPSDFVNHGIIPCEISFLKPFFPKAPFANFDL